MSNNAPQSYTPEVVKVMLDANASDIKELKTEVKTLSDFKYTVQTLSVTVDKLTKSVDKLNEERFKPALSLKERINNLKFSFIDKLIWLIGGAFFIALFTIIIQKIKF